MGGRSVMRPGRPGSASGRRASGLRGFGVRARRDCAIVPRRRRRWPTAPTRTRSRRSVPFGGCGSPGPSSPSCSECRFRPSPRCSSGVAWASSGAWAWCRPSATSASARVSSSTSTSRSSDASTAVQASGSSAAARTTTAPSPTPPAGAATPSVGTSCMSPSTTPRAWPTPKSWATRRRPRRSRFSVALASSLRATASASSESSPTTARPTSAPSTPSPAARWAFATCAPALTDRRPTARPNGSSAPCSPAGPTARSTAQVHNAPRPLTAGSGTTTIAADTKPSGDKHPSPDGLVSAAMVVVPEPAVKGRGALWTCAVDRAVGPAGEHGADEPFGLAVGLRSVRAGAQVANAHRAAGDGVDGADVGRAVVGDDSLDADAVARKELASATEKRDRRGRLLVAQDFGVGQARGVVDGDMHEVPTDGVAAPAGGVGEGAVVVRAAAEDPLACTAVDASELLDVDVDELTRALALVALGRHQAQAPELAHATPLEHRGDGRKRHSEQLGELGPGEPQPPKGTDRRDRVRVGAVGHRLRRRGTIAQSRRALTPKPRKPLARRPLADPGRPGRITDRPPISLNSIDQQPTADRTEPRVSVASHPVSPWCWGFATTSLQGGPDEQRP